MRLNTETNKVKFNGMNYQEWSTATMFLLMERNLWNVVEGEPLKLKEGETVNSESYQTRYNQNKEADTQARGRIGGSIDIGFQEQVRSCGTASEMWNNLRGLFEVCSSTAKVNALSSLVKEKWSNGQNVIEHIGKMEQLFRMAHGTEAMKRENELIPLIMLSMGEQWSPFFTALRGNANMMNSYMNFKAEMVTETVARDSILEVPNTPNRSVNYARTNQNRPRKFRGKCFKCKRTGHKEADCYAKITAANQAKQEQNGRHSAFMANTVNKYFMSWWLDSGCTDNMCNDISMLSNVKVAQKGTVVRVANNEVLPVTHTGKIKLYGLNNMECLFVPGITRNLMSVAALDKIGCSVTISNGTATILDKNGLKILGGILDDHEIMYKLDRFNEPKSFDASKVEDWHSRLGHANQHALKKAGIDMSAEQCDSCDKSKAKKAPFTKKHIRADSPLELIHCDLAGPMETPGLNGEKYYALYVDDCTDFTAVYLLKNKSEQVDCFIDLVNQWELRFNHKVKKVRSDNGTEFINNRMKEFCHSKLIKLVPVPPYTPECNGVAERRVGLITDSARCMLTHAGLGKEFWPEAVLTAAYLRNRTPTSVIGDWLSAYERSTKNKPDLGNLRVFGCLAYSILPGLQRKKWDLKAEACLFIGYNDNGYNLMVLDNGKIIRSRSPKFVEDKFPYRDKSLIDIDGNNNIDISDESDVALEDKATPNRLTPMGFQDGARSGISAGIQRENTQKNIAPSVGVSNKPKEIDNKRLQKLHSKTDIIGNVLDPRKTRSAIRHKPEGLLENNKIKSQSELNTNDNSTNDLISETNNVSKLNSLREAPEDYYSAISCSHKNIWRESMEEEYNSLVANKTWEPAELPKGRRSIKCRWVYALKYDENGNVIRAKSRLVAKGFSQKPGLEYDLTHSPVIAAETFRLLCAIIAINNLGTLQVDIKNAYLNGKIDMEVYIEQPVGFVDKNNPNMVYKLLKALYGLKQAGRIWYDDLSSKLEAQGFIRSEADPCLMLKNENNEFIAIAIYVDDLIIAGKSMDSLNGILKILSDSYDVKNLGKPKFILGIHIYEDQDGVKLNQRLYIEKLLEKYGMTDSRPTYTPLDLGHFQNDASEVIGERFPYRELVGSIGYIAKQTRPDISFAYGVLSRKLDCATMQDWKAAKRILAYLKTTIEVWLVYSRSAKFGLAIYCDSDYAGTPGAKSTSGFVLLYAGGAVSWHSKRQDVVAQSTSEAELISVSTAGKEIMWVLKLLKDFGVKINYPVRLYEDNQPAIALSHLRPGRDKLKHLSTKQQYIRELVAEKILILEYIPTEDMLADLFTKPLPKLRISKLRHEIGCVLNRTSGSVKNIPLIPSKEG